MSQQGPLTDFSSAGSDIETLTGNTGGPVGPDGAFNINILGGDTTTITGDPGTNTLTVDSSVGGYPITPYVVGPSGQAGYTTIQDALDAANSVGGGIVGVQPGTYTEDLTLYDATEVVGFGSNSSVNGGATLAPIVITGTHTPPLTGSFVFKNLTLTSAGSVIFSASALGTATINVEGCIIGNISGYLFDLDSWGGGFSLINTINPGLGNRGINNTVGSNVFILQSELGSFGALSSNLGGTYRFQNATCRTPIAFLDGSDSLFNNGSFLSGFTTAGAAEVSVYESLIQHASSSAITHEGDDEVIVSNCTISSSTDPSIAGSGAGQLSLTGLDFTSNSSLAGTLTVVGGTSYSAIYKSDYTDHGVILGQGATTDMVATTAGTDGQLLIGATAADPAFASLTSTGETLAFTSGANSLNIDLSANAQTTAVNGWNGSIKESAAVTVTSDGATITCSVEQNGGGDLTVVFSDGFYDWDTTPADTVTLTAGTDTAPQLNYVYFLQSTKTLTVSTTSFPATEYAPIATVFCQSAASLQTEGAYKLHAWTDHVTSSNDQGHIPNLNFWIRQQNATWESGVTQTYTITPNGGSPDNVLITTVIGSVLQLHTHTFPAFSGTPDYYVINDPVTPYTITTDLNTLLTDSTGASMSGRYFSLVLWGVVSEDTADCKLFINLPSGSYNNSAGLIGDISQFANFTIPDEFKGTGFLISQWSLRHQAASGGTWTSIQEKDLRGLIPSITPGGTSGTPTEFDDSTFRIFDNGDDTKEIAFEASSITTATTRTITMSDYDLDLSTVAISVPTDSGTATPAAGVLTIAGGTNINTSGAASTATVNLDGDVLGLTDLTVDNLELNGNTLSSTDTNGDVIIAPDGSGTVSVTAAPIVPSTDRADSLGSATNSWDNVYADGLTFDDGSNIMSAYETGSWTPVLEFGGASVGITYSNQSGTYTRIGNFVFIRCVFNLTNKGSSTGNATITGLPFASVLDVYWNLARSANITLISSAYLAYVALANASTTLIVQQADTSGTAAGLSDVDFANNSILTFTGGYFA